jgi:preprotein translocase subunit SecA
MDIGHLTHLQVQVVKNRVIHVGTVAAAEAGTEDTLLAVVPFQGEHHLIVFS